MKCQQFVVEKKSQSKIVDEEKKKGCYIRGGFEKCRNSMSSA